MSSVSKHPFQYRTDRGGAYISFCRTCFLNVAKGSSEAEIAAGEQAHKSEGPPPLLRPGVTTSVTMGRDGQDSAEPGSTFNAPLID
jgi:hypothetical protein